MCFDAWLRTHWILVVMDLCTPNPSEIPQLGALQHANLRLQGVCIDCLGHIEQNRHMKRQMARTNAATASSVVRRQRSKPDCVATFRNSRGEKLEPSAVTASEAKSEFGRVLEMVIQGGTVVITKHDVPKAVLISVESFNALSRATETRLDTLGREFDVLLARMQTPKARLGMKTAFAASGKELGKAAVAAARTRG